MIKVAKMSRRILLAAILMLVGIAAISLMAAVSYSNQTSPMQEVTSIPEKGLFVIGAGIAAGLAAFGASLGLGTASAAAIAAIAEKPELFGQTLVYIVLIEAVAIYGLAMFFIIFSLL